MKKILSLVLAMLMIFSMVPAVFAAETSESDYQAAIEYLKAIELYKGTTDGDAADELVERYQMALFTARMVTGRVDKAYWETDANDSGFTDIDTLNAEALGGVCYAAQQGIVNGIGGSEFAPFDNVTYRDAIVMIVRALGFNYPASGYPWSYINKARELGVLDGITGVAYTAEVKREVIAQLLYNAMNAEIKGETIAASVFGVEETIVMVTATPNGIVYKKDAAASIKAKMVRVSAIDAEGEPVGTEYYVPFAALNLKDDAAANAAVGSIYKLTHKGNFSQFLACESLTEVFENTTEKKEVAVASGKITLGKDSYTILASDAEYSSIINNQGTLSGNKEIKVFKAFGASNSAVIGNTGFYLGTDGRVYSLANPFVPYAVKSDVTKSWFKVTVNDHGAYTYAAMTDPEVEAMLATIGGDVKGFTNIGNAAYIATRMASNYGVDYDYYKAIASDIDNDGDFDRVTVRAYRLYHFVKDDRTVKNDQGNDTKIGTFTLTQFGGNGLTADLSNETSTTITVGDTQVTTFDAGVPYVKVNDVWTPDYSNYFRFTGIAYNKLPDEGIIVAYLNTGVGFEKELEVVDVADKMSAYIRGYDQASDSVIYGSDYETIKLGYMGVAGTSIYRATQCHPDYVGDWKVKSAAYVRQFWNTYVDMYVLNNSVIYIDNTAAADDYVILESFTNFSEDGLSAIAYSTKAGGKVEILVNELNGWNLGGFDYALYEEMIRLQALLPGLGIQAPVLPVELNKVYAVRYVNEAGAYNLVEPREPVEADIYVNNYGYILGVDKDGKFAAGNRVATSDKDLWFILVDGKVLSFQGKLASIRLDDARFYKAKGNQFVLEVDDIAALGPILGNSMEGVEYFQYNTAIDNAYRNENYFGGYVYGHAMMNMRSGRVEFVTYDSKLAYDLTLSNEFYNGRYIYMTDGDIFQTVNKVLKSVATYNMGDVAALEFANGTYAGRTFIKAAVGAVLPANVDVEAIPGNVDLAFVSYEALVDYLEAVMYREIYNDDFHNGNLSYEEAIKKELMTKVTFVNRTATAREEWKVVKNNAYVSKTLGTDTHAVYAYVMFDFANREALVYVDTRAAVQLTSNKTVAQAAVLPGVDAEVTYDSNVLKNETLVTVKFSKPVNVSNVTVAGKTISNLWIGSKSVTFTVPVANFEATDDITVTGAALNLDASNKVTGIDGTTVTFVGGNVPSTYAPCTELFDGDTKNLGFNNTTTSVCFQTTDFATILSANLVEDATLSGLGMANSAAANKLPAGYYWNAIKFANATGVTSISSIRLYHTGDYASAAGLKGLYQGLAILVSEDGTNWTKVADATDLVNKGEWTEIPANETDGTLLSYYVDIALSATTVKANYVAIAEVQRGTASHGQQAWHFLNEIELYK